MYKVTNQIVGSVIKEFTVQPIPGYRLISHSLTTTTKKRYLGVGGPSRDFTEVVYSFLWEKIDEN